MDIEEEEDIFDLDIETLIKRYVEIDLQMDTMDNNIHSNGKQETEKDKKEIQIQYLNSIIMNFQLYNTKVLDFFSSLQFYMCNPRDNLRQKAIELIFQVFSRYKGFKLQESEFFALFEFFVKKLHDVNLITYSIKIIQLLFDLYEGIQKQDLGENKVRVLKLKEKQLSFKNVANNEKIFDLLYSAMSDDKIEIGSYTQEIRLHFYKLFYQFSSGDFKDFCLKKGTEFIEQAIIMVEEEKDPRNIIYSFKIFLFILENFPLS